MTATADLIVPADILPVPFLLVTASGAITAANRAFCLQLEYPREALVGRPLADLVSSEADTLAEYLRIWARSGTWAPAGLSFASASGRVLRYRTEGMRFARQGETPGVLLRLVPRSDATEQFARLNRHIADLTAEVNRRKRLESERLELLVRERAARGQAELANRLKDEFLATLSHELRTPLNAIVGWAHILRDTRPGARDKLEHGLAVIERNARLQGQLVEDLLDVSRIVTGKLRLDFFPVDIGAIIEAAVDAVRPAASNRGIGIDVRIAAPVPIVRGDAARLQQVIWNLLSNAVKFTQEGGAVSVEGACDDRHAEIVVRDTGQGISADFLPHVFDRFRQADSTIRRNQGGLGLGLALVRAFTEAHGGTVHATSAGTGLGATFTLRLPLYAPAAAGEGSAPDPLDCRVDGLRVLVVDDDCDARELTMLMVETAGAVPLPAGTARDALALLQTSHADVVLADLGMPDVDGFDLIRQIRALPDERLRRTPAVAVTAYASVKDRDDALRAGYQAHVAKPVDAQQLVTAMARAMRTHAT